ncbi:MAG: hypothetical protein CJBNEKGG_01251 [Prosthecobacter sp.]|nr:hypothetical protein [Prosthecobacter sp.]
MSAGVSRLQVTSCGAGGAGFLCAMFEKRLHPLASRLAFAWRFVKFFAIALGLAVVALGIGTLGYHFIAGFTWVDSLLNASMILGGMGPVGELPSDAAKLFASAYALFSGLMFITIMGLLLAPAAHRILHAFHLDETDSDQP